MTIIKKYPPLKNVQGYGESYDWLGEKYKDVGFNFKRKNLNLNLGNYLPISTYEKPELFSPYINLGLDLKKNKNISIDIQPGQYLGLNFTKSFADGGEIKNNLFNRTFRDRTLMKQEILNENPVLKNVMSKDNMNINYARFNQRKLLEKVGHNPEYFDKDNNQNGVLDNNKDFEKVYNFSERDLYPGEDKYFKENPHVGGMATEDNFVIINPYSTLSDAEKDAIRKNETARLAMRNGHPRPTFDLTPEQQEKFKNYSNNLQDQKETIVGRIISGDPSVGNITPEQQAYAAELQKALQSTIPYKGNINLPEGTVRNPHPGEFTTLINKKGLSRDEIKNIAANDFTSHALHYDAGYQDFSKKLETELYKKYPADMIKNNGGVDGYMRAVLDPTNPEHKYHIEEMQHIDPNFLESIRSYIKLGTYKKYQSGGKIKLPVKVITNLKDFQEAKQAQADSADVYNLFKDNITVLKNAKNLKEANKYLSKVYEEAIIPLSRLHNPQPTKSYTRGTSVARAYAPPVQEIVYKPKSKGVDPVRKQHYERLLNMAGVTNPAQRQAYIQNMIDKDAKSGKSTQKANKNTRNNLVMAEQKPVVTKKIIPVEEIKEDVGILPFKTVENFTMSAPELLVNNPQLPMKQYDPVTKKWSVGVHRPETQEFINKNKLHLYKQRLLQGMENAPAMSFKNGGALLYKKGGNLSEKGKIECHNPKCDWEWNEKDAGKDKYVCHKCGTDNTKFYGKGGTIHIDKNKKGTFTAAATKHGMGVQEFAKKVLADKSGKYSSLMHKKANFARNASKFKH